MALQLTKPLDIRGQVHIQPPNTLKQSERKHAILLLTCRSHKALAKISSEEFVSSYKNSIINAEFKTQAFIILIPALQTHTHVQICFCPDIVYTYVFH